MEEGETTDVVVTTICPSDKSVAVRHSNSLSNVGQEDNVRSLDTRTATTTTTKTTGRDGGGTGKEGSSEWYKNGDAGGYMSEKRRKLQDQFVVPHGSRKDVFMKGCVVWVDGWVDAGVSMEELGNMVLQSGGTWYKTPSKDVTHVVVGNLPFSKAERIRKLPLHAKKRYVTVQWILDSVRQRRKMPTGAYIPRCLRREGTSRIDGWVKTSRNASPMTKGAVVDISSRASAPRISRGWAGPNPTLRSTRSDPQFVRSYFEKSRLHFIGSWRSHLHDLPSLARRLRSEENSCFLTLPVPSSSSVRDIRRNLVMHVDMDCFFAQVALRNMPPSAKREPVIVAHGGNARNAEHHRSKRGCEVSCANYPARSFGICAGMGVAKAMELCPSVRVVPYLWDEIRACSRSFYETLVRLCPGSVHPLSIDEAYLTFPGNARSSAEDVERLMSDVRQRVREATGGCTCSIGASWNSSMISRLATRKAKPDGQFFVSNPTEFIKSQPLRCLPGVGRATASELEEKGLRTCADIQALGGQHRLKLQRWFGDQRGLHIWKAARGEAVERTIVDILDSNKGNDQKTSSVSSSSSPYRSREALSIGAEVNWGVRFESGEDQLVCRFVAQIAEELSSRLCRAGRAARALTVKVMIRKRRTDGGSEGSHYGTSDPYFFLGHGRCDTRSASRSDLAPTIDSSDIMRHALVLYRNMRIVPEDLRGFGISASKLCDSSRAIESRKSAMSMGKWLQRQSMPKSDAATSAISSVDAATVGHEEEETTDDGSEDTHNNVLASTPPSWSCDRCTMLNSGWLNKCEMCDTLRHIGQSTKSSSSVSSSIQVALTQAPPSWSCDRCQYSNSGWIYECEMCGTSRSRSDVVAAASVVSTRTRTKRKRTCALRAPQQMTLTQLNPQQRRRKTNEPNDDRVLSMTQLDPSVLAELPEELRRHVEERARLESSKRRRRRWDTSSSRRRSASSPPTFVRFQDIRDSLTAALGAALSSETGVGARREEKRRHIEEHAIKVGVEMIRTGNLEGAACMMRFICRSLIGEIGKESARRIEISIQEAMKVKYKSPLVWYFPRN